MKKILLTTTLFMLLLSKSIAQTGTCPTNINVTSSFVTLTYSPSLPNSGFIDQLKVKILNGQWKTLSLHSKTSTTITFNNQNARLSASQVAEYIQLIRSGMIVANCSGSIPLPVDFLEANAFNSNGLTTVDFKIANEVDILEYRVLDIDDNVLASSVSTGASEYTISFKDKPVKPYYVRVMAYDLNGDHSFTGFFAVNMSSNEIIETKYITLTGIVLDGPVNNCVKLDYYFDKVVKTYIH